MRPFSIVLVLFASAQFTAAVPATVERESTTIPSRLLTGYFNRGTIEPTNLLFNTSPDRRSIANDSFVNQTHASTTPTSTSTTTRTTTPQVSTTTKSDGLLSVQLLKSIEGEGEFIRWTSETMMMVSFRFVIRKSASPFPSTSSMPLDGWLSRRSMLVRRRVLRGPHVPSRSMPARCTTSPRESVYVGGTLRWRILPNRE